MIKLINGTTVEYTDDFDRFFQNLLDAVIQESRISAKNKSSLAGETKSERELFLQEIMDNCIFITYQLFNIYKENEKFSQFIVTGFIFNSVIIALREYNISFPDDGANIVH
ncbi:MAG TPA: hypothetical protein PKX79_04250 [Spirochaetota bacterium]|jgi:hypothetical protein|nr:hypothetical protein [Spirochaetota bacterium]OQA96630.1 MAG: hypothetical protein BWY23_01913 [Spirochaetes bacterium ADurb.Bin218]HOK91999.1 hypothetical protein [Spirochaetota bacterium]HOQ11829.1 hypothetical protein [Spirochaetota bacterium]HOV07844.1 hypothetical protein [Spirochaetota bacterium]